MSSQYRKTFIGLALLFAAMALVLFAAAGTIQYWQGWVFLAVYFAVSIAISIYLIEWDPALLERRMRGGPFAEQELAQKVIMTITSFGFIALIALSGIDHRLGWSDVPPVAVLAGNLLVLFGWIGIFLVFRENSFSSATIERAPDQRVISTGPYALVRHPMYAAALVMVLGIPIALGSWWSILVVVAMIPAFIWRMLDEERFLTTNLPGYAEYMRRVRYRLLPGIF